MFGSCCWWWAGLELYLRNSRHYPLHRFGPGEERRDGIYAQRSRMSEEPIALESTAGAVQGGAFNIHGGDGRRGGDMQWRTRSAHWGGRRGRWRFHRVGDQE